MGSRVKGLGQSRQSNAVDLGQRFSEIYREKSWTAGRDDVPLSGAGSTLQATEELRSALPDLLVRLGTKILLDVGCGDFSWMKTVRLPCRYIGIDIVPSVIADNAASYSDAIRSFFVANAVCDTLPFADAALCREVIFHLSFADARALLLNLANSDCEWIMLTTDRATGFNSDIRSGDFRLLNLEIAPFRLGAPQHSIEEPGSYNGRRIGVWRSSKVREALA